ncbi:unnamed protein product [Spirodela intermedia]|uniref:Uncharacterized protein n=1 Tax=Spirodela intermedia TaxID=51605 RepID=A0A7I8L1H5_SPIIN|nr:unnamed protein product [Spirodela intermedia]
MAAAPHAPSVEALAEGDPEQKLLKQIRGHEVAVVELNSLHPNRAVYQRNGIIYFRKEVKVATAFEQKAERSLTESANFFCDSGIIPCGVTVPLQGVLSMVWQLFAAIRRHSEM